MSRPSSAFFPVQAALRVGLAASGFSLVSCGLAVKDYREAAETVRAGAALREARAVTREQGLAAARDLLAERLAQADLSRGEMERRVARATRDPDLAFPDSWATLPAARRSRVALVIVPGTKAALGLPSKTRDSLREAARQGEEMGFHIRFIETPQHGSPRENAELLAQGIAPVYGEADHVVLVMLSKGAHDVIHYLQDHAINLPRHSRSKIKAVLSLAGTTQGSVAADWFARSPSPAATSARLGLRLTGRGHVVEMLEDVGRSPWRPETAAEMAEAFPRLTWVSLAMLPDGADGRVTERVWAPTLRREVERESPYYSPEDGLVETAAAVLPDEVGFPQWIIRGYGSHALTNGRYPDGTRIAPLTTTPGEEDLVPASGAEVISAYLRSLPVKLLR